jgi:penicillin-binding protein A
MKPEPHNPTARARSQPDWRTSQARRKRSGAVRKRLKRLPGYTLALALLLSAAYGMVPQIDHIQKYLETRPERTPPTPAESETKLLLTDVRSLLQAAPHADPPQRSLASASEGVRYLIETSLDPDLQRDLLAVLNPAHARYIAVVAIDPATGRILAMVGYDDQHQASNPCLENRFPAASIFKIVSAAAAIEQCRFDAGTQTFYNGKNHTLYKSQLKERQNRYTRKISFQEAFAKSINPVFGKIGAHCLGKAHLQAYGEAFGFNRPIEFELPLETSRLRVADEPYQWAEVASGFNRETTLSPLHGALIAAALVNDGMMMAPRMVERVSDAGGNVRYRTQPAPLGRVASPETCRTLQRMMSAVVDEGTCKKVFRRYRRDRVLSRLAIGGKSGSINNRQQDARFDWFVGFAREKDGPGRLAVSAVVAHEDYIGKRAAQYARETMRFFFQRRFALNDPGNEGKSKT